MKKKRKEILTLHPGEEDDVFRIEAIIVNGVTLPLFGHGAIYNGESLTILNFNGKLNVHAIKEDDE